MATLPASHLIWPEPTVDQPTHEEMETMMFSGKEMTATDGCNVYYDQVCEHGFPAWNLVLDYNPLYYGIKILDLGIDPNPYLITIDELSD